jgi:hypothetical protein
MRMDVVASFVFFRTADVERDWVDVPLGRLEGVSQKYPGWFTWNNHFL